MRFFRRIFSRVTVTALLLALELAWIVLSVYGISEAYVYAETVFTVFSFAVCIWIINRPGSPEIKLAWIALAVLFPIVGWLIYLLTGGRRPTARLRRRLDVGTLAAAARPIETGVLDEAKGARGCAEGPAEYLDRRGYPLFHAEDVGYYRSGEEALPAMLDAVRAAKSFVFLEYFIIGEGEMWSALLDALTECAARGVDVRVLYDGVGCIGTLPRGYAARLSARGIRARVFNPARPIFSAALGYRDHRKILVVDGCLAFTGGINIADEYINRRERFGYWKDSAVHLSGKAVATLTALFLETWSSAGEPEREAARYFPALAAPSPSGDYVQPYGDSPLDGEPIGESVYLGTVSRAERYVWFSTPYLVIDHALSKALVYAARRGVEVRIVLPGIPDKRAVYAQSRASYAELLEGGVQIFEYTPGFMHGKCCLSDDRIGVVGTVNLDYRSFGLHFENGCVFYGTEVVGSLRRDFEEVFSASRQIRRARRRGGPLGQLWAALLRLLAPLL